MSIWTFNKQLSSAHLQAVTPVHVPARKRSSSASIIKRPPILTPHLKISHQTSSSLQLNHSDSTTKQPESQNASQLNSTVTFNPRTPHYITIFDPPHPFDLYGKSVVPIVNNFSCTKALSLMKSKQSDVKAEYLQLVTEHIEKMQSDQTKFRRKTTGPTDTATVKKAFRLIRLGETKELITLINDNPELLMAVDVYKQTLLHWACKRSNLELGKYLINSQCLLEAKDMGGNTPLMLASQQRNRELTQFLRERLIRRRKSIRKSRDKFRKVTRLITAIKSTPLIQLHSASNPTI